jgi:hypothetical protein
LTIYVKLNHVIYDHNYFSQTLHGDSMRFEQPPALNSFAASLLIVLAIPSVALAQSSTPFIAEGNKLPIAIGIFLYLLPAWIAWSRKHHQKGPIILVNVLLGWTIIGWLWALVWSVSSIKKDTVVVLPATNAIDAVPVMQNASPANSVTSKSVSERIADLKGMLDNGAISQAEYELLKADTLKGIS